MEREEAIAILKDISWQMGSVKRWENIEAIDKAIEALSAETHANSRSTHERDLISRADAIEAVAQEWLSEASAESPYVNDDDIGEYRKLAEELFEDIPSAEY